MVERRRGMGVSVEPGSTHYSTLDGLRGLAALTVLVSHFSNKTDLLDLLFGYGAGRVGVTLFSACPGF